MDEAEWVQDLRAAQAASVWIQAKPLLFAEMPDSIWDLVSSMPIEDIEAEIREIY